MSVSFDYDADPQRYRLGMRSARRHAAARLPERVAALLGELGAGLVLDVGCADGALRAALRLPGPRLIGVDVSATMLAAHLAPVACADARRLPFADAAADAVTALNAYYHLPDPLPAVQEAHRVLRGGAHLLAATIARDDSPELRDYWHRPATSFDAEDAPGIVGQVFDTVTVHRWDAPLVTLPDPAAVHDYLRGRQAARRAADVAARELPVPLTVTKRGALVHATRRPAAAG